MPQPLSPVATAPSRRVPAKPQVAALPATRPPSPHDPASSADAALWNRMLGPEPLGAAELQALAQIARRRQVEPGATVYERHAAADSLVVVSAGAVVLGFTGSDGVFRPERPLSAPAWLDEAAAWAGSPHALEARAASAATIVELPRDALLREFERHPGLARRMIASLAREVQALTAHAHALTRKDAQARFAGWLAAQVEPAAGDPARARIRLGSRKRDLAGQLGVTPETLSRVMRGFSESGLIRVAGYTLEVLDLPALRALAERE